MNFITDMTISYLILLFVKNKSSLFMSAVFFGGMHSVYRQYVQYTWGYSKKFRFVIAANIFFRMSKGYFMFFFHGFFSHSKASFTKGTEAKLCENCFYQRGFETFLGGSAKRKKNAIFVTEWTSSMNPVCTLVLIYKGIQNMLRSYEGK